MALILKFCPPTAGPTKPIRKSYPNQRKNYKEFLKNNCE